MPSICLRNVTTPHSLKNVSLTVGDGELMVLLGPSGAGKSTLLNVIAGLTEYRGDVYFGGKNVNKVPVEKRGVGYLLQDIYLFPHMNVFENVAFGLRAAAAPANVIASKVEAILELLNISHLKNRYPKELSGGEKQRVGLARSLSREPQILLLDEPMASLDPFTARKLRKELKTLHCGMKLTALYVTHAFDEACELADRIGVLIDGKLIQVGSVREIFSRPVPEIREFITLP